jgi:hypothetical protein
MHVDSSRTVLELHTVLEGGRHESMPNPDTYRHRVPQTVNRLCCVFPVKPSKTHTITPEQLATAPTYPPAFQAAAAAAVAPRTTQARKRQPLKHRPQQRRQDF